MADDSPVPIKDYVDQLSALHLLLERSVDAKNMRYIDMVDRKNREAIDAALASEQLARTVALGELKGYLHTHNDVIRRNEREQAIVKGEMVTKTEFRPIVDFVERSRQSAITTGKFVTVLLATAGLCLTFGFGFANYLQSARTTSAARTAPTASNPQVVIPLPPAQNVPAR